MFNKVENGKDLILLSVADNCGHDFAPQMEADLMARYETYLKTKERREDWQKMESSAAFCSVAKQKALEVRLAIKTSARIGQGQGREKEPLSENNKEETRQER